MKYTLLFLLFFTFAFSQNLPSIQTDRPDQTECPFTVPVNYFQFENGISYEKINNNSHQIIAPNILSKFGVNDHFEVRLITEFVIDKYLSDEISGINPISIGFKVRLWEAKGILPLTSFIGHISLPKLGSKKLQTPYYIPEFRFAMQHTLSDKQTLSYNLGAEWNGITAEAIFIYTITTGYSFTEKIGGYIEFYGFFPQYEKPDNRFDCGMTYLLNSNNQFDISGGLGFSEVSPDYYFALGYSFRFKV